MVSLVLTMAAAAARVPIRCCTGGGRTLLEIARGVAPAEAKGGKEKVTAVEAEGGEEDGEAQGGEGGATTKAEIELVDAPRDE